MRGILLICTINNCLEREPIMYTCLKLNKINSEFPNK